MADAALPETTKTSKSGKMPLLLGLLLAVLGGAGGFYATRTGLILSPESPKEEAVDETATSELGDIAFVPIEPLTVSLPYSNKYKHLRFRAELEVTKKHQKDVEVIVPRVVDVLNSYLRALELSDIEQAASLTRLRAQMLRRVQIVAGPGLIKDLLIMEFVLN